MRSSGVGGAAAGVGSLASWGVRTQIRTAKEDPIWRAMARGTKRLRAAESGVNETEVASFPNQNIGTEFGICTGSRYRRKISDAKASRKLVRRVNPYEVYRFGTVGKFMDDKGPQGGANFNYFHRYQLRFHNEGTGTGLTEFPVHLYDITCRADDGSKRTAGQCGQRLFFDNTTGRTRWVGQLCSKEDGSTATSNWQLYQSYLPNADVANTSAQSTKAVNDARQFVKWLKAEFMFYGTVNQHVTFTVALVKFRKEFMATSIDVANGAMPGTSVDSIHGYNNVDQAAFWQSFVKPKTFNPLAKTPRDELNKYVKFIKSWSCRTAASAGQTNEYSGDNQGGQRRMLKVFININKVLDYAKNYNQNFEGNVYGDAGSGANGLENDSWDLFKKNNNDSHLVKSTMRSANDRLYLMVYCNNYYDASSDADPPASTSWLIPQYDMVLYKKVVYKGHDG